jgi:O-antigen ligase
VTGSTLNAERRVAGSRPERPRLLVRAAAALLVVGAEAWRRGEYFSGSLDPVVVGKALVSLVALALALLAAQSAERRRLGTGSLWLLGVLLGSSVFGALTSGAFVAGTVVAIRVGIVAATVVFLLRAAPALQVLTALVQACGAVALVAILTGLPTLAEGRLAGGIPAIDPNELALLAGIVVVFLTWRAVLGDAGPAAAVVGTFFLAVVWATGSRTGLLMLLLGVLVMGLHMRRPQVGLVVGGLVVGALGVLAVAGTGAVGAFVERGGDGTSTLGSRFIAWREALVWATSDWQTVFGGGLSVKIIRVRGQYWDTQPLDSTWASLLVQTGVLGLAVATVWICWTFRGTLLAPRPYRVLFLGLLVFLVGRSLLESGLFDATPAFVLFVAVSLLAEGASRRRLRSEAPEGSATARA